jgi:hypothetical protein
MNIEQCKNINIYTGIHFGKEKNQYSPLTAVLTIGDLLVVHARDDNK